MRPAQRRPGADGGFRALYANFSNPSTPILYATTTATTGNRLVEITGGTLDGSPATLVGTVLATAAPNTAFRGVATAPTAAGSTTSTTTLAVTGSPSDYASGVTLTATVTTGATGWVSFVNQATGVEIGAAPLVGNTATLSTAGELAPGSYSNIVAIYTGDGTYAASTSTAQSASITQTGTSVSLNFTPNPVGTGQSDLMTAVVSVPAGVQPTGTVSFTDPSAVASIASVVVNGTGAGTTVSVTTSAPAPFVLGQSVTIAGNSGTNVNGTFTITAVTGNSSGTTFTYASANAVAGTGGTATSTTYTFGSPATVTQFVESQTGPIEFEATLTVPANTFAAEGYSLNATYSGDTNFSGSSGSNTLNVVNSTTTTVTSSAANPAASPSQSLTLTATVTSTGAGTPTGSVQFYDNTLAIGTPVTVSGGVATVTVKTSLVQSVTITQASETTSGSTTVTITTNANNPMTVGESVTVEGIQTGGVSGGYNGTFSVSAVSGKTFSYVDNNANGLATDSTGGVAVGLSVLTPGLHSISAVYTPDVPSQTTFAGSTGVHQQSVQSATFGANDVFQERNGDGITSLNTRAPNPVNGSIGATVYIDELTSSGTLVQSLILPSADSQSFAIASASGTGSTVTVTTTAPNDFATGQTVTISGITGTGAFTGDFVITVTNSTTFTYSASGSGSGTLSGATAQGSVHAVVGNGQQSPTGQMTLSGNGADLVLTGYDNNPLPYATALPLPSASGSQNVPRSIAQISATGAVQTMGLNTSLFQGDNFWEFDGIYSPDGNQVYVSGGDNGFGPVGIFYFPSITQSANLQGSLAANQIFGTGGNAPLGLESYGGNLYAIGGGPMVAQVGPGGLPVADVSAISNMVWSSGVMTVTANNNYVVGQLVDINGVTGTTTGYNTGPTATVTIASATGTSFTYNQVTAPTGTPGFAGATASLQAALIQLSRNPTNQASEPEPISTPISAYFTHTNGVGTNLDTIYVADQGKTFGAGAISKWSLMSSGMTSIAQAGTTATVTLSSSALGLTLGEVVNLTISGETGPAAVYNGAWAATVSNSSTTSFTFTTAAGLPGDASPAGLVSGFVESGAITYSETASQLGFYWLAGVTNSGTGAVTLYSTYGNGGNGDFGPGILYSVTDSNGFGNAPGTPITAANWANTAGGTVTITAANNYQVGNEVNIAGVSPAGYDGLFQIVAANSTSFTYALASNPGAATVTGAYAVSLNTVDSVAYEGVGTYVGNEVFRGVALAPTNTNVSTTTTVQVNQVGPYIPSSSLTFTATITGSPGVGTVTFYAGPGQTNQIGSPVNVVSGSATSTPGTTFPLGSDTVTAVFSGGTGFAGSTGTANFTVVSPIMVNSVVVDAGTDPIISTSFNRTGNVMTVTLAGLTSLAQGAAVLIANTSIAADNGAFTVAAATTSTNTFTYVDNNAGAASSAGPSGTATIVGAAGTLGNGAVGSSQRSMVDSIVYTFNQAVTLGSNAFTLALQSFTNNGGGAGNPSPGTLPGAGNLYYASPDGGITWVVTFSGANTVFNSIADGAYKITLNAAAVTAAVSGGTLTLGSSRSDVFYRLYGDNEGTSGTGTNLGNLDYGDFVNTYLQKDNTTSFNAAFDMDGNTKIDNIDYGTFASNYETRYKGLTPTI